MQGSETRPTWARTASRPRAAAPRRDALPWGRDRWGPRDARRVLYAARDLRAVRPFLGGAFFTGAFLAALAGREALVGCAAPALSGSECHTASGAVVLVRESMNGVGA